MCLFVPLVGYRKKEMTARVPERRKYLRMRQKLTEGWSNRIIVFELFTKYYTRVITEMKDFEMGGTEREKSVLYSSAVSC